MRCFYCNKLEPGILDTDLIPAREKNHIFKVLRGKEDTEILLIDGKGAMAEATIESNRSLRISKLRQLPVPETKLHLFVAPPRKNQMDQLLKQCAEIGVWSITPMITERSVAKPAKESSHNRMEVLLMEGCKQAQNPFLPILNPINELSNLQTDIKNCSHIFFGSTKNCGVNSMNQNKVDLRNSFALHFSPSAQVAQLSGNIAWIVGPEGGFTDNEEQLLVESGAKPLQLGCWVMRVETAVIVGASFLLN